MKCLTFSDSNLDFEAFICIESTSAKLSFGGCRFSTTVTRNEVELLANCMALKLSPYHLPIGGAKGGFKINPNRPDLKEALKLFANKFRHELATCVVLGKDLGATDEIMDYIYSSIDIPQLAPVMAFHKSKQVPNRLRDFVGYEKHMTGKGVAWSTEAFFNNQLSNRTACIQGAGAVGVGAAFRLGTLGVVVKAISDKNCAVVKEAGFKTSEILEFCLNGEIKKDKLPSDTKVLDKNDLFLQSGEILILAANSHTVEKSHVSKSNYSLIVEGSNFGLTDEAREFLSDSNVPVIPDVIASSSSAAFVAFQMASGNSLSEKAVWQKIEGKIKENVSLLKKKSIAEGTSIRKEFETAFGKKFAA